MLNVVVSRYVHCITQHPDKMNKVHLLSISFCWSCG